MSKNDPIELELPDGISDAEQAIELIRAWIVDGSLMVSLNADAFGDRVGDWGRLLAEIGHHVAKATVLEGHMEPHEAIQALSEGFERNIRQEPTAATGGVKRRIKH